MRDGFYLPTGAVHEVEGRVPAHTTMDLDHQGFPAGARCQLSRDWWRACHVTMDTHL